jgi:hypothetical protein
VLILKVLIINQIDSLEKMSDKEINQTPKMLKVEQIVIRVLLLM